MPGSHVILQSHYFCLPTQFSYADFLDVVTVIVAILLSIASGVAESLEVVLTGEFFNIFISYNTALRVSDFINDTNTTCRVDLIQQLLPRITNGSNDIFCDAFEQGNVVSSASTFVCDPDQTLTDETTAHSLYFVYLAVGSFVAQFISHMLWTISATRQTKRMRIEFYRSILRHEISWFDTNDTSTLGPLYMK